MCVYKLSGANAGKGEQPLLSGQAITFPQPLETGMQEIMSVISLPHIDIHELVSITLVGPKKHLDWLMSVKLLGGLIPQKTRIGVLKKSDSFTQAETSRILKC